MYCIRQVINKWINVGNVYVLMFSVHTAYGWKAEAVCSDANGSPFIEKVEIDDEFEKLMTSHNWKEIRKIIRDPAIVSRYF